jgi:hypothetical protein
MSEVSPLEITIASFLQSTGTGVAVAVPGMIPTVGVISAGRSVGVDKFVFTTLSFAQPDKNKIVDTIHAKINLRLCFTESRIGIKHLPIFPGPTWLILDMKV